MTKIELSKKDIENILHWYDCKLSDFGCFSISESERLLYDRLLDDKTELSNKDVEHILHWYDCKESDFGYFSMSESERLLYDRLAETKAAFSQGN